METYVHTKICSSTLSFSQKAFKKNYTEKAANTKKIAGKLMGVLVCSWTHARKLEFKVLSSQWETFQIFVAVRWPLRSVCTQKTPDEQTGETDEQPARRGDVSINTQRENLVWKHIIKLKLNEPESKQLTLSIAAPFFWAYDPHSMKMRPSRFLLSHCTTTSVNASQPRSLWELAWCARTVSTALSNSTPGEQGQKKKKRRRRAGLLQLSYCGTMIKHLTKWGFFVLFFFQVPCWAHPVRSPCPGCWKPLMSELSSLNMFSKLEMKRIWLNSADFN